MNQLMYVQIFRKWLFVQLVNSQQLRNCGEKSDYFFLVEQIGTFNQRTDDLLSHVWVTHQQNPCLNQFRTSFIGSFVADNLNVVFFDRNVALYFLPLNILGQN